MKRSLSSGWSIVVLLGLAACGGKHLSAPPSWLDLSGTWQLNARESQDPAALQDSARARPRGAPGGMPGAGGMPGGGRPGGGPGRRPEGMGGRATIPLEVLWPVERFTIEQGNDEVTFRFAPKEGVIVPTTGRAVATTFWPGSDDTVLKARWLEDGLEVERRMGEDKGIKEVYTRGRDAERLVVTTNLPGGRTLRRVYERLPPQ